MARNYLVALVSFVLLLIARFDLGPLGSWLIVLVFSALIYAEFYFIRTILIDVYADAITEHKVLLFFMKHRMVNALLSAIMSAYFAFYLFIHVNLVTIAEMLFYAVSAGLLAVLLAPSKASAESVTKSAPAKAFARTGLIFVTVLVTVILDGAYNTFAPVDPRIKEAFDVDIPLYVIDDVQHSYIHFQHLLRTMAYIDMNVLSMELSDRVGEWFSVVRFLFLLYPSPYVGFALLFLSISSLRRNQFSRSESL